MTFQSCLFHFLTPGSYWLSFPKSIASNHSLISRANSSPLSRRLILYIRRKLQECKTHFVFTFQLCITVSTFLLSGFNFKSLSQQRTFMLHILIAKTRRFLTWYPNVYSAVFHICLRISQAVCPSLHSFIHPSTCDDGSKSIHLGKVVSFHVDRILLHLNLILTEFRIRVFHMVLQKIVYEWHFLSNIHTYMLIQLLCREGFVICLK